VSDAGCSGVIYSDDLGETAEHLFELAAVRVRIVIGRRSGPALQYEEIIAAGRAAACSDRPVSSAAASIMYTSGTTGHPKGAILTHRQMLQGIAYTAVGSGASPHDVSLQVMPQFHAGANMAQMAEIFVGATTVVTPQFDPELVISLVKAERASFVCLVPSMISFLLECPELKRERVASLKRVMYGGSAIAPDRLTRALGIFGADFQQVYGQTEACVFATLMDGNDHRRALAAGNEGLLLSCGRPALGYAVKIVDEQGCECPPHIVGELVVSGDSVMSGYWNLSEATAKALRFGWLYTGDLGYRDENNYFFVVDRKVDLIVSGGENVYPVEVENAISAHPKVLEVAVIGVPDPVWGEAVKAVVVAQDNVQLSENEIIEFCRDRIARFKTPKSIDFVSALPRTPSGKVMKGQLRKEYWSGKPRGVN
jgi:acyl-CoA synthetase (AMP-forming)/AMP-acid ligase II